MIPRCTTLRLFALRLYDTILMTEFHQDAVFYSLRVPMLYSKMVRFAEDNVSSLLTLMKLNIAY